MSTRNAWFVFIRARAAEMLKSSVGAAPTNDGSNAGLRIVKRPRNSRALSEAFVLGELNGAFNRQRTHFRHLYDHASRPKMRKRNRLKVPQRCVVLFPYLLRSLRSIVVTEPNGAAANGVRVPVSAVGVVPRKRIENAVSTTTSRRVLSMLAKAVVEDNKMVSTNSVRAIISNLENNAKRRRPWAGLSLA